MPIRWKLTVTFSVIVLAILALTGVVLYFQLGGYLLAETDRSLNGYSARVHGSLLPARIDGPVDYSVIHSQLPAIDAFSSPGVYLEIIDGSGNVVVKSVSLSNQVLPPAPAIADQALRGVAAFGTVRAGDGTRVRMLATPLYLQDQTLVLAVAQSLKLMDTTMTRLRLALLVGVLLAVVLVATTGAVTLTRALRPVQRIARIARDIEQSADLSRRVGQTGTADEIGPLATTFDHMIEHLETVFRSQKQFIADASHELRSPLTIIRGNLDLLRRHPEKEDQAESLRAIDAETTRMSRIVADLLLLAEVETARDIPKETVRLHEVVSEEIARARGLAPGRSITAGRHEDLSITGDSHRIRQLLGNLLDNAIKHTPPTATITVALYREGDWARLDIIDTGPGIAAKHLPHLFDRFYRVDQTRSRSVGSHGLGLAIVKGIAEQHGGTVTVTSDAGTGSTFSVRLKV
jgi:two-component system OmpR family sensor kinase